MTAGASDDAWSLRTVGQRASAGLLLVLWPLQLAALLASGLPAPVEVVALALFAAYLVFALGLAGWSNAVLSLLLLAAMTGIGLHDDNLAALLPAASDAMVFAALLPALHLLQAVAGCHPAVHTYRTRLAAAPPGWRSPRLLIGGHLLGGALTVGAIAVLSPALEAEPDENRRRRAALALVAGISLALLWSPLFVAMAVVSAFVPEVSLPALVLVGLAVAAAGIMVALVQLGQLRSAGAILARGTSDLGPLLPWVTGAAAAVVGLRSLTALSTLEAACLVVPALCLGLGWPPTGRVFRAAWARTRRDMQHMSGEVAVVALAFMLGIAMRTSPTVAELNAVLTLDSLPAAVTLFSVSAAVAGASALGVHPIVAASLALSVVTPQEGVLSGLALAGAALVGWSCGAMLAVAGLLVIVAVGMLGVSRRQLMLGENAVLAACVVVIGTLLLTALNAAVV